MLLSTTRARMFLPGKGRTSRLFGNVDLKLNSMVDNKMWSQVCLNSVPQFAVTMFHFALWNTHCVKMKRAHVTRYGAHHARLTRVVLACSSEPNVSRRHD